MSLQVQLLRECTRTSSLFGRDAAECAERHTWISVCTTEHPPDRIVTMLSRVAPGDVVRIAQMQFVQIARQPHGGVLTLSLLAALWSTSSGMTAIVDTLNQAFG